MNYQVKILPAAHRQLAALSKTVLKRVDKKILALSENPRPSGVKKLQTGEGLYRVRIGDYRVVYAIDDSNSTVLVIKISHRSDVYE